jgi:hypothetical protein
MKSFSSKQKGIGGFALLIIIFIVIVAVALIASFLGGMTLIDILKLIYVQTGIWFALIGGGVALVITGITLLKVTNRPEVYTIAKVGMVMISLSLLVVIGTVFLPLVTGKVLSFEECKELISSNVYKTTACIFAGYAPSGEATAVTYFMFLINAILCPFVFFYYMFSDLMMGMKFPSSENARKSIAFIGSYLALRGALTSYFIEFFTYGWFGMGALVFGVFMEMMAWQVIKRYFAAVIEDKTMGKIFRIISGKDRATPQQFFSALTSVGMPWSELHDHADELKNWFTAAGYPSMGNEILRIINECGQKGSVHEKNEHARNELEKLANA